MTEAERHRQIHYMLTATREEGGASITPKLGEWENVDAIFPLHDHERNRKWLNSFSSKTFLTPEDLDQIRDVVGEKVRNFDPEARTNANGNRSGTTTPSYRPTSPFSCFLPLSASLVGFYSATSQQSTPLLTAYGASYLSSGGSDKKVSSPSAGASKMCLPLRTEDENSIPPRPRPILSQARRNHIFRPKCASNDNCCRFRSHWPA